FPIYVRAGLGVGVLAEMAVSSSDTDLRGWPAPPEVSECIAWAVLPRERVLRDYALELVHVLAPQIDKRDLRRVLDGNQEPDWPIPPAWEQLNQPMRGCTMSLLLVLPTDSGLLSRLRGMYGDKEPGCPMPPRWEQLTRTLTS